jgi:hypothetical protein
MTTPVLSLTTRATVDPTAIAINGTAYPLRSKDDLTWAQTLRYSELYVQLVARRAAVMSPGATAEDEAALTSVVNELLQLAVDAPADVLTGLRRDHKLAVISAAFFDYRPPTPSTETQPATAETMNATS